MLGDEEFKQQLAAARHAAFDAGIYRIQALTGQAVTALEDLLSAHRHPAVRLGAARTVLEIAANRTDAETLLRRVEEIEQRQRAAATMGVFGRPQR